MAETLLLYVHAVLLWIESHPVFVVALFAVPISWFQLRIATGQMKISLEQQRLRMAQEKTDKALALIVIDPLIVNANLLRFGVLSMAAHSRNGDESTFDPEALQGIDSMAVDPQEVDLNEVKSAAAKAFPDEAPDIVLLAEAYNKTVALAKEYRTNPWPSRMQMRAEAGGPPVYTAEQTRRFNATDAALNSLVALTNKLGKLQPHARE
jgi:hypothetical protein